MISKVQTDVDGQRTRLRSRNTRLYSDNRSSPSFVPKRVRISVLNQAACPASPCPAPAYGLCLPDRSLSQGMRTIRAGGGGPLACERCNPRDPLTQNRLPRTRRRVCLSMSTGPSRHALHCMTVRVWRMRREVGRDPTGGLRRSRASPPLARPVSNKLGVCKTCVCQTQTERSVARRLPSPSFQHLTAHHGRQCRASRVRV